MTWQNWIIAVMFALSFIDRVMNIINGKGKESNWYSVAALVLMMFWFGVLIAVLHSGDFW